MTKLYEGSSKSLPNLKDELKDKGIKYCLSIGRRQPMHIAHLDCLREIISVGLIPVIIYGSHNQPTSSFYNPLKNPLNAHQQETVLSDAMKLLPGKEYLSLFIQDHKNNHDWISQISQELTKKNILKDQSIIHFRTKASDIYSSSNSIKPLCFYNDFFRDNGFDIWQSHNEDPALDAINSTDFRAMSIDKLQKLQHNIISANYIIDIANKARKTNPIIGLLRNTPISMADISLKKLIDDTGIHYEEVVKRPIFSIKELQNAISSKLINQASLS